MIDEKKIVHAASDYADKRCEEDEELSFNQLLDAFEDGANWLLDSLWHEAKEERPTDKSICLCYDKFYKQYRVLMYDDKAKYWCDAVIEVGEHVSDYGDYRITRWLYIDDLMKGGK